MLKQYLYQSESFTYLKRRIYIVLLPVFILVFGVVMALLYISEGYIDPINNVTFSLLITGLSIFWAVLVKKPERFWLVELSVFILATVLFLLRMFLAILDDLGVQGDVHLGTVSYWASIYYFLVFLTFRGAGALFVSISTFSLIAFVAGYHVFFSINANGDTIDTLMQFTIATLGNIVVLYYIQRMIETYLEAEITKYHANTDYLTKLPNRRKMEQILQQEKQTFQDDGTTFTVSMFDIDYFKKVNDTYGHDVGDKVLQELTSLISGNLKDNEYIGRWGGEEFLMIFSNSNLEKGKQRSTAICQLIHQHNFPEAGNITCSFGIAQYEKYEELKDLLKRTDDALYIAKAKGRNRVECA
ncbi:diguanylate cyclase [Bacillus sp. AK031]